MLPTGAFGNIFISVSVSQEPGVGVVPVGPGGHGGHGGPVVGTLSSIGGLGGLGALGGGAPVAAIADLKRFPDLLEFPHRAPAAMSGGVVKSVSVATGPDQPYVPMSLSTPSLAFATLPRRHLRAKDVAAIEAASGCRATPHYDNMGPRVTANGSSTLSLPDEDQLEATVCSRANSRVGSQDLPPPPPPPHCTSMSEYVAL